MRKIATLTMFLILLLAVQWAVLGVDDVYDDLEEIHSTTNFDIYYTDDSATWPDDWMEGQDVIDFGEILENARQDELIYGFDEIDLPYRVYLYNITREGILGSWLGRQSQFEDENGASVYVHFGRLDFDSPLFRDAMDVPTNVTILTVALHEFFHVIQEYYTVTWTWSPRSWIIEGQASMIMDKIYTNCDESAESLYTDYVQWYLKNPDRSLMRRSYTAALFWTYLTEQYGTITTEPDRGLDFIVDFWKKAQSNSPSLHPFEVITQVLSDLGHPEVTFEDVFKDFVVANYAKNLTGPNVPDKYKYYDDMQPPGPNRAVSFLPDRDETPPEGSVLAGFDIVDSWAANYYRYKRDYQTSDLIQVDVNQVTNDNLFFALLEVKDEDLVSDTVVTGSEFHRSLTTDADEIVLVIAGLDNNPDVASKYIYSISPGTSLSVDILSPEGPSNPTHSAYVGSNDNPQKFLIIAEVLDLADPVLGLSSEDFEVRVGEADANVASTTFVKGLYYIEAWAPIQDVMDTYDLTVTVADVSDSIEDAIIYSETKDPLNSIVVIDRSGSMGWDQKIEAAQSAASLFVNSFFMDDRIGLVQFNEDAQLLHGLGEVSTIRETILDLIEEIDAQGWTSVGDGLYFAQNELYENGVRPARSDHIILLSDGVSNRFLRISDVDQFLIENNTVLDVVLVGIDAEATELQWLAGITGGNVYFAFDPSSGTLASDLADIYRSVAEKRRNEQRVLSRKDQKSGVWGIMESFDMDNVDEATVVFNYRADNSISNFDVSLHSPNLANPSPTYTRENQAADLPSYYGHLVWHINNPVAGNYVLNITGSGEIEYMIEVGVQSPIWMNTRFDLPLSDYYVGTEIPVLVTLADESPILDANVVVEITTGTSYVDSESWQLHLYDDGSHGDGLPDDGVYGNYFTRTAGIENYTQATYNVIGKATGISNTGHAFTRESVEAFHLTRELIDDMDADLLPDLWEQRNGLSSSIGNGDDGAEGDPDLDGLTNYQEFWYGTSPTNSDTDKGGENDHSEIMFGRDPYYAEDDFFNPPRIHTSSADSQVTIFFNVEPSYSSLSLYRSLIPDSNYNLVESGIDPSTGNYTDYSVINDNKYYYKMIAVSTSGEKTGFSAISSATPKIDTTPPWGTVSINNGDKYTDTTSVNLDLIAENDVVEMRISNSPSFYETDWINFDSSTPWTLPGYGLQYVYVQFKDAHGNIGGLPSDVYDLPPMEYAADGIIVDPNYLLPEPEPIEPLIIILGVVLAVIIVPILIYVLKRKWRKS